MVKELFAVIGNTYNIAIKELSVVGATNINRIGHNLVTFFLQNPKKVEKVGSIIKSWSIHHDEQLKKLLTSQSTKVIWVGSKELGLNIKRTCNIKRYKLVEKNKTDKEIKEFGTEIIELKNSRIGIVEHYQNIKLYEAIDFEKPISGMKIGMMPSKLTQILINLADHSKGDEKKSQTIYDPFCGFATTIMIANAMWYNAIGSDINITSAKTNIRWWKTSQYFTPNPIVTFKHDVKEEVKKDFLKQTTHIVTEWRLGPVQKRELKEEQIHKTYQEINLLYKWVRKICNSNIKKRSGAICVPYYSELYDQVINTFIDERETEYQIKTINENLVYKRPKQNTWRLILLVQN